MCRLAAKDVSPGGSFSGTQKPVQNDVSPDGGSSPTRWFLEKVEKHENHTK